MTHFLIKTEPCSSSIDLSFLVPNTKMTTEQFYTFCLANQDLRIERTAKGEIIVMPPAFADTGNRNLRISQQLANWAEQNGTGEVFDSSAGFTLPNGAIRSPDTAWIRFDRWNALSEDQKASFAPLCPDFVVELRSAADTLKSLQEKLQEYMENGSQLGLLIDRKSRTVYIYRPGREPEQLREPDSIFCDPELSGFVLQMAKIW
ncbi:MAG: Uma2 family endonuclease [Synechococcaceae cyanobacterium SM2_3_1]|nr:Uma2 family endonuclease [Synechococcaceae cyanobacterium SM2_3_1]